MDKKIILAYALKNAIEHEGKAVAGSVISGLFNHGLTKDKIKNIMPSVNEVLKEINSFSVSEQEKEFEKLKDIVGHRPEREGLSELNNVGKKGVVMRFAPSPSGLLHIGHVMTGMLNSLYVKKYKGKFYFRIEDTNPENIYEPAYKLLKKEADWIFGNVSKYIIQSDRMKIYYKYAEELIKKESAYICTCNNEKFKELINANKACPCRILSVKDNLFRWKKMLSKSKDSYREGEAVLRFKSDLNDSNPAMRDFPLARINLTKHPRQGKKYRVWPLMNLCVTVDDIELKITHAIRAKDHRDNALRQKMIYSVLGLEKIFPENIFLGRYNFIDMDLSASAMTKAIKEKKYSGWDDIRLSTVAALRKRGYQKQAFEKMVEQRGISEVDKVISRKDLFDVLDNFNRDILKDVTRKTDFELIGTSSEVGHNEKEANMIILMPDAKKVFGKTKVKPKKEEIIYFSGFCYAKNNGKIGNENSKNSRTLALRGKASSKGKNAKPIYWFLHE